jgi:hypothetical protein
MSELRASPSVLRLLFAMVWAVLLAGCIPHPVDPPAGAPTNVVATPGDGVIALAWSASDGATGYSVKRAASPGGPYTRIAAPASTSYADAALVNGTTYYYVVSAFNKGGESANSAEVSAIPSIPRIPLAPTNVIITPGNNSITLSWSASAGAATYHVKRSTTRGGPYTQVAAPASTTYINTALTNGVTYYYVVSAENSLGESPNSSEVSATPSPPPPTTFGTWTDVTPSGIDLTSTLCSNYGATSVQVDPAHPSNLYAQVHCQGIWKSTDYGLTWAGPINAGSPSVDCSGSIAIPPGSSATVPVIYQSCIRGNAVGFWKSPDGGVNWTRYNVGPVGGRQDYYAPAIDPYDQNHLLMVAHEFDALVESVDGGLTWANVPLATGMLQTSRSASVFFINTGSAPGTRGTWLWIGDGSGGAVGTWRTANSGASWVRVEKNEQVGAQQIYQPDTSGVVFMAGAYSDLGWGVLRSSDFGQTWSHVGDTGVKGVVFGTTKNVYAMYSYAAGPGVTYDPGFSVASQPGTGIWVYPAISAGLTQGPAQIAVVNDGVKNIIVGAMFNKGIWRYVEP